MQISDSAELALQIGPKGFDEAGDEGTCAIVLLMRAADNVVVGRDWALSEKDVLFDGAGSPKEGKRKGSRVSKALASVRRSMTPGK